MKTQQEIKECKRLIVIYEESDGGVGEIHLPRWKGSIIWGRDEGGWEHVSVAPGQRRITPSWEEMCLIKDIFFYDEECAVQYHPPKSQYVNVVPNCLHLWRLANGGEVAMPKQRSV